MVHLKCQIIVNHTVFFLYKAIIRMYVLMLQQKPCESIVTIHYIVFSMLLFYVADTFWPVALKELIGCDLQ